MRCAKDIDIPLNVAKTQWLQGDEAHLVEGINEERQLL
jgi:hypothetical protein